MAEKKPGDGLRRIFLLYHELRSSRSEYSYAMACEEFARHLDLFARLRGDGGGLQPEITFDDGHISNYEYALPMLQAHRMVARFFLTVGWIGEKAGYMGWDQVRALQSAGHEVGAHGWTHTLLTQCSAVQLEVELVEARQELEARLGVAVTAMSLPGGRFNPRVLDACRAAGYREVFSSIPRAEPMEIGPLVGRVNIRGDRSLAWMKQVFTPGSLTLNKLERAYRRKEAMKALLGDGLYARLWAVVNRQDRDAAERA